MAELPTVRIVNPSNPDDYVIINESDYDPDTHELWEERDEGGEGDGQGDAAEAELEGGETPEAPEGTEEASDDTEGEEESEASTFDTVGDLEDAIAELEDPDEVRAIRDAEAEGEDRVTAIDACNERIAELEGEEG